MPRLRSAPLRDDAPGRWLTYIRVCVKRLTRAMQIGYVVRPFQEFAKSARYGEARCQSFAHTEYGHRS